MKAYVLVALVADRCWWLVLYPSIDVSRGLVQMTLTVCYMIFQAILTQVRKSATNIHRCDTTGGLQIDQQVMMGPHVLVTW